MSSKKRQLVRVYQGSTLRREKTRGDIEHELRTQLNLIGTKLLSINWKKKTAHYIDSKGHKRSDTIKINTYEQESKEANAS